MQTSGIGSQDNWARFMQLSNQARMRNEGLSGAASSRPPAAIGRVATVNVPERSAGMVPLRQMPLAGATYTNARPVVEARIVGGRFDAYA